MIMKRFLAMLLTLCAVCALCACGRQAAPHSGQICLYGESHADTSCLEKELAIWGECYGSGMRHLFLETPCYTASYLNQWMRDDSDEILLQLYDDIEGTQSHSPDVLDFYRAIKNDYPETVFHGTDIGHQYNTTGMRYLAYLEAQGQSNSAEYEQVKTVINQGMSYYRMMCSSDSQAYYDACAYRENCMTENFIAAFDALGGLDIMGIYGAAHTGPDSLDFSGTVPCMSKQLNARYGDAVHAEDLSG